jgi:beta-lactamase superfamily II metal-dependent hydrolase
LIATEKFMLDNPASMLASNVIIAPHHGAKNGSSRDFAEKADPNTSFFLQDMIIAQGQ